MWNNDAMGGHSGDMGGGYMNSPGYGSTQQSSQAQIKAPNRTHNNIPCTIAQIVRAEVQDDNFVCDGITLNQVTLIGIVRSANESATNLSYVIDDMSGPTFEVRQFVDNDENTPEAERVTLVRENVYVRIYGHLRSFNGKRSIVAFTVRPLMDLNELTSHLLEMLYVRAYHRKQQSGSMDIGMASTSGGLAMVGNRVNQQQRANQSSGAQPTQLDLGLTMQQQQVLNVLRTCSDETGISVASVCGRLKGMPERIIRECIEFLGAEGHVYSTIDDDHYKATDAL